jgi:dihydroxyacetone kinase-like protein
MELAAPELNALDGDLGDGDLGVTMMRAGEALSAEADDFPDDIGLALLKCAQIFQRASAGTYGTLVATGLRAAGKTVTGRTIVPWRETSALLATALASVSDRGRAQLGDKTVLDAIEAACVATEGVDEPSALIAASSKAVAAAIDQFRNVKFRQGRARIFGEKGIGKDDPGMVAFQRILEALAIDS